MKKREKKVIIFCLHFHGKKVTEVFEEKMNYNLLKLFVMYGMKSPDFKSRDLNTYKNSVQKKKHIRGCYLFFTL